MEDTVAFDLQCDKLRKNLISNCEPVFVSFIDDEVSYSGRALDVLAYVRRLNEWRDVYQFRLSRLARGRLQIVAVDRHRRPREVLDEDALEVLDGIASLLVPLHLKNLQTAEEEMKYARTDAFLMIFVCVFACLNSFRSTFGVVDSLLGFVVFFNTSKRFWKKPVLGKRPNFYSRASIALKHRRDSFDSLDSAWLNPKTTRDAWESLNGVVPTN